MFSLIEIETYGWITYFLSLFFFFLLGYIILDYWILEEYEVKNWGSLVFFCSIFSFSIMYLELIIFEILKIGSEDSRYWKWLITTCCLTYSCVFFVPSFFIFKFIKILKIGKQKKLIGAFLLASCYLYLVIKLLIKQIENQSTEPIDTSIWEIGISILKPSVQIDFITNIGTFLIGILSGFGAVNCPFTFFNFLDQNILKSNKTHFEENLLFILKEISYNKYILINLQENLSEENNKQPEKKRNLWGILFGSKQNENREKILTEIKKITKEIKTMKKLHNETFLDYCEYLQEKKKEELSKTLYGKFLYQSARFLSVYCSYKLFMSTLNYILGRKKGIDPISRVLKWFYFLDEETYEILSSNISFVFMGYLMVSNVRSFSLNLIIFIQILLKSFLSRIISVDIVVYLIAEAIGVYFVSTLMLLQTSLPSQYLNNIKKISNSIDIISHYRVFDIVFIVSSLTSLAIIWINVIIKNQKYSHYVDKDK